MMKFFMKLLVSRQIKIERGEFRLFNQNVTVIPITFLAELTKYYMSKTENKKQGLSDFYFMAWAMAYDFMERFSENYKIKTFEDRWTLGMDIVAMTGLGDYKTIKWEKGKLSHVYVENNPVAKYFYPSKAPIDYFYCGLTAGGAMIVHKLGASNIFNCVETECGAVNGKKCVFVSAVPKKHEEMGTWDAMQSFIDIDYVLPKQIEFFKKYKQFRKGNNDVLFELI